VREDVTPNPPLMSNVSGIMRTHIAVAAALLNAVIAANTVAQPLAKLPRCMGRPHWAADVFFSPSAIALAATERERLLNFSQRVLEQRDGECCTHFKWGVVGYADRSEGSTPVAHGLAELRAEYVKNLLARHGALSEDIYTRAALSNLPPSIPLTKSPRVEMEVLCHAQP